MKEGLSFTSKLGFHNIGLEGDAQDVFQCNQGYGLD